MDRLRKSEWEVRPIDGPTARAFIAKHHYARGSSNTSVVRHGLFRKNSEQLEGAVVWLPPTRRACESVNKVKWRDVLSLSRMAVAPGVPLNACSFLLGRSIRSIVRGDRYLSLVTYADEWQGHDGHVYTACNWIKIGLKPGSPKWVDPITGRQVSRLSTKSRSSAVMKALGYKTVGTFGKVKFVMHKQSGIEGALNRLGAALEGLTSDIGIARKEMK